MLYLTGFISEDKDYNRKSVSVKEMAEIFGVTEQLNKPVLEFTHINVVPDPINGGVRHPRGFSMPSTFTAIFNGQQIEVTYSKGTRTANEGNTTRVINLPEELLLLQNRETDSIVTTSDKELSLFWLLHPRNQSSPIAEKGLPLFRTLDKEKENKAKNNAIDIFDDLMLEIKEKCRTMPDTIVRKAKVINVQGRTVSGVNWALDAADVINQVRYGLRELAQTNPFAFKDAWQSPDLELKSIINDCFDKGIMTEKPQGGRNIVSFNGVDICNYDPIEDRVTNVQIWVNDQYGERYKAIANALKDFLAKKETEKAVKGKK